MKTTVSLRVVMDNSVKWELRKLVWVYKQIVSGFYQANGFYLLDSRDRFPESLKHKVIRLHPDLLQFCKVSAELSRIISSDKKSIWFTQNVDLLEKELREFSKERFDEILPIERNSLIDNYFDDALRNRVLKFCEVMGEVKLKIVIHLSHIGTGTFFYDNDTIHLFIYPESRSLSILSSIIGAYIREKVAGLSWNEYMAIQQFITLNTIVGEGLSYTTKSASINKVIEMSDLSDRNFLEIGFPRESEIKVAGKLLLIGDKSVKLSSAEIKVIKHLLDNPRKIIDYEELGDLIWSNSEKYSLQAVNKYIERIRKKIHTTGITKEYIHTQRGAGYVFVG